MSAYCLSHRLRETCFVDSSSSTGQGSDNLEHLQ